MLLAESSALSEATTADSDFIFDFDFLILTSVASTPSVLILEGPSSYSILILLRVFFEVLIELVARVYKSKKKRETNPF